MSLALVAIHVRLASIKCCQSSPEQDFYYLVSSAFYSLS